MLHFMVGLKDVYLSNDIERVAAECCITVPVV